MVISHTALFGETPAGLRLVGITDDFLAGTVRTEPANDDGDDGVPKDHDHLGEELTEHLLKSAQR